MAMKNPYAKYSQNAVNTASKEELTLMLYEGALKYANQALVAIDRKEFLTVNELLKKVQDIVKEFQLTLDFNYEISNEMNVLYDYIHRLLVAANLRKDKKKLNEAIDLLREFRDTWKQAMILAKQPQQSTPQ